MYENAVLYCRLSRDDGEDRESSSITTQKAILTEYAKKHRLNIVDTYIDDGYSGTNFNRPGFQAMLHDAEQKKFEVILVKDLSRFGRNYIKTGYYTEEYFPERNIRIIAINDNFDSEDTDSNDFAPFKNIINEWYTKDISRKIRQTHKLHQDKGIIPTGKIPLYGYKYDENRNRIIDEVTAPNVRLIYDMYVEGKSMRKICEYLTEHKIIVPGYYNYQKYNYNPQKYMHYTEEQKYTWRRNQLERILLSDEYTGDLYVGKTYVKSFKIKKEIYVPRESQKYFEKKFEPIITEEVYRKALKIREANVIVRNEDYNSVYRGVMKCYNCGHTMLYRTLKSQNRVYFGFGCRQPDCPCRSFVLESDAIELVNYGIEQLKELIKNHENELRKYAIDYFRKHLDIKKADNTATVKELEQRNDKLNSLIEKLFEENLVSSMPRSVFDSMLNKYNSEFKLNDEKIKELTTLEEKVIDYPQLVDEFIESVYRLNHSKEIRRDKLMDVFEGVYVHKRKGQEAIVKYVYKNINQFVEDFKHDNQQQ